MEDEFGPVDEVQVPDADHAVWLVERARVLVERGDAELRKLHGRESDLLVQRRSLSGRTLWDQSRSVTLRFLVHLSSQKVQLALTNFPSESSLGSRPSALPSGSRFRWMLTRRSRR